VDRGFCLNYVLYNFELMELEWGRLEGEPKGMDWLERGGIFG